jgi:hypothetical protein
MNLSRLSSEQRQRLRELIDEGDEVIGVIIRPSEGGRIYRELVAEPRVVIDAEGL